MNLNLTINSESLDLAASQLWSFLSPELNYLPSQKKNIVYKAFQQMVLAHNLQRRKGGDFYITHPVQACHTLAQMKMDSDTLSACLLHDVPEDTDCSLDNLGKIFNPEIIFLVSGVTKLSIIKYQQNDIYAKNLRRLFIAMSQDLRVILIKLADRIHNLSTLNALPPEKAKRIALESLEIYVPIAKRLGIHWLSRMIEELAFEYAYPEENKQINLDLNNKLLSKNAQAKQIIQETITTASKNQFKIAEIIKKNKTLYSIFKNTGKSVLKTTQQEDIINTTFVTKNISDCLLLLNILKSSKSLIVSDLKNHITEAGTASFKGLRIKIKLKDELQNSSNQEIEAEIQIRTSSMQLFHSFGMALLWSHKLIPLSQKKVIAGDLAKINISWLNQLVSLGHEELDQDKYLEQLVSNLNYFSS